MILLAIITVIAFIIFIVGFSYSRHKTIKEKPKEAYSYSEVLKSTLQASAWVCIIAIIPCMMIGMWSETTKTVEVSTQTITSNEYGEPFITGIASGSETGEYNVDLVFENSDDIVTVYGIKKADIRFVEEEQARLVEYETVYTSKITDFCFIMDPPNEKVLYLPKQGFDFSWFASTGDY